jgi:hypothetical protein
MKHLLGVTFHHSEMKSSDTHDAMGSSLENSFEFAHLFFNKSFLYFNRKKSAGRSIFALTLARFWL